MADEVQQGPPRALSPEFAFRARLDGLLYGLRFVYNSRMQRWFMDLEGADGTPLVSGLRVAAGHNMLRPFVAAGFPPGQLFALDDSGLGRDPDRFGWRGDFRLIYRPAADVLAAAGTVEEVQ